MSHTCRTTPKIASAPLGLTPEGYAPLVEGGPSSKREYLPSPCRSGGHLLAGPRDTARAIKTPSRPSTRARKRPFSLRSAAGCVRASDDKAQLGLDALFQASKLLRLRAIFLATSPCVSLRSSRAALIRRGRRAHRSPTSNYTASVWQRSTPPTDASGLRDLKANSQPS
jgi:hypothetical protein